ncbi:MAG: ROK family transcriptional regulator [Spirochaetota bacterium]
MELPTGERASYNFYRVLRSIWRGSGVSRTELAATHKLDKTTISQIVAELIEQGIVGVQEIDTSIQRPGRKSELLTVSDDWGIVAGIELRPDGIRACATDMHANVIAAHHHRQLVERTTLRDAFMNSLEGLQADDRVDGRPLVGVGVGLSGIVNAQLQSIVKSIPLNILDPYDFREQISRHVRVPVLVDNDADCGAWSELVHDGDQRSSNFMFVLIEFRTPPQREHYGGDIGVGFGFVIDGSVYYGGSGAAGEFRSLYWHPGYRNQLAVPDAEAHDVLDKPDVLPRVIEELASHVGVFANVLDLGAVYVGGDVSTIKDLVLGSFYSAIQNNWPYDEERDCVVELASLEDDIVAVGAASMVLEHIFQEPVLPAGLRARNRVWQTILSARAAAPVPRRSP